MNSDPILNLLNQSVFHGTHRSRRRCHRDETPAFLLQRPLFYVFFFKTNFNDSGYGPTRVYVYIIIINIENNGYQNVAHLRVTYHVHVYYIYAYHVYCIHIHIIFLPAFLLLTLHSIVSRLWFCNVKNKKLLVPVVGPRFRHEFSNRGTTFPL